MVVKNIIMAETIENVWIFFIDLFYLFLSIYESNVFPQHIITVRWFPSVFQFEK